MLPPLNTWDIMNLGMCLVYKLVYSALDTLLVGIPAEICRTLLDSILWLVGDRTSHGTCEVGPAHRI